MTTPPLRDRRELAVEWIRRFLTYTTEITWFGGNGVMQGIAQATAGLASGAHRLYVAARRRFTLLGADDADLPAVAAEFGAIQHGAERAKVLVVFVPRTALVAGIRDVAGDDYIEVDDATYFAAAATFRIRSADGSTTEAAVVASVSVGTGPVNGGDELVVTGGLAHTYDPNTEDIRVIRRVTKAVNTSITSLGGPTFETLAAVTIGDANPVLDGEGAFLSLADKVWAEATEPGSVGNIEPLTLTGFATPDPLVESLYNPEAGLGGEDLEASEALKYRAAHTATALNEETLAWAESVAKLASSRVLRATTDPDAVEGRQFGIVVVGRNGGNLTSQELEPIAVYITARVRGGMTCRVLNATLTSVEVEAEITLLPGYTLRQVWKSAAARLAASLDYRTWNWGDDVDEADLLTIVNTTPGVGSLVTETFSPSADVAVGLQSFPVLTRLSLRDTATDQTLNADLAVAF